MLKEFKEFIMKGNVLDLAVAVIIGVAFAAVVKAMTAMILMPLIAAIIGGTNPSFDRYSLTIRGSEILWGSFLAEVTNFVIIAFALFLIIKAFEKMQNLRKRPAEESVEAELSEVDLLIEIRDLLSAQRNAG